MAKVLIVYYSRSGHTRKLAEALAQATGWDLEALVDTRGRAGLLGYLRSAFEARFKRSPPIEPVRYDPANYDLVVLGTPVWNLSLSSPMRSYLSTHGDRIHQAAYLVTLGGRGSESVFKQMTELIGAEPVATLAVTARDVDRDLFPSRLHGLARGILRTLEHGEPPHPELSP